MNASGNDDLESRLSPLRRDLLRARSKEDVVAVVHRFLAQNVDFEVMTQAVRRRRGGSKSVAVSAVAKGTDEIVDQWLSTVDVPQAFAIDLGASVAKRIIVGARSTAGDVEPLLAHIADDLAQALEMCERVESGEVLVRVASDALSRDAREVIRVVAELEKRNETVRAEFHTAYHFQRAMLSPIPQVDGFGIEVVYLPAETISGDFYDIGRLESGTLRVFLADATGHGIAAGLATMFIKSEYEALGRRINDPSELLRMMNDRLSSRHENLELRFSGICMDIDVTTGSVLYSTAAHPAPLVHRGRGGIEELPSGGSFVGVRSDVTFPRFESTLDTGDSLVLYTDGLHDATRSDGELFGEERVHAAIARAHPSEAVSATLVRSLSEFVGAGHALADDTTILDVRRLTK